MGALRWVVALALALPLSAPAQRAEVPYLTGRVVDTAEILKPDTRRRLAEALRAHEQATTNQIAVLTVPTLHGESVEEYALRVFEQWKLGQKGKDNGVLVVVAPQDRRMRIEVGYGLEGTLPDATAARIIRNVMTPRFREGDFDGGVTQGAAAIIAQLEGKPAQAGEERPQQAQKAEFIKAPDMALHEKVLFGAFIFGIIGLFTFIGIVTPGVGWFLYFFLIPFWAMFPIAILGSGITFYILIAYLVGFPLAKLLVSRSETYRKAAEAIKKKGYAKIGGFTVGGSGGSWSSSGSSWSSGGGFSGGGGSSGGSGASGSW
ncbi:MAG: TPM domain-containing protein [Betaproteobacteria bacterium]|nr:TPM domain-containing protein [Betaproteobacteria bacterium]